MEQKEKFINLLQRDGKKSLAEKILYISLEKAQKYIPSFQLTNAIDNVKPVVDTRKVRKGGTTYQIPFHLSKKKQQTKAIKWIIESAEVQMKTKQSGKKNFAECLARELCDAFNKQGYARLKRDQLHKLAELNRAYTRYRWW